VPASDYIELIRSYGYKTFTILDARNPPAVLTDLSEIMAEISGSVTHRDMMII
jgi:hypothetical protein